MQKHEVVIIGGGGGGLTAALAAKKTSYDTNVTLITKDPLSYSPCALPFVISGEIDSFERISKRIEDICRNSGITCVIDEALGIDTKKKAVKTRKSEFRYTSLIIATGGTPLIPPVKGTHLKNVYTLYRLEDAEKIMDAAKNAKSAVVVGGGAIGLEAAAALIESGLKVTLIEGLEYVLSKALDADYSQAVENKLAENGIELIKGINVEEITGASRVESVKVAGKEIQADMVIMVTGLRPNVKIAESAGIETLKGCIKTDEYMESGVKGVFAAGDCAITKSLITGKPAPGLLGTIAIRQGTVAGMNSVGEREVFENVLGAMILRIFDIEVGRTGITEKEAKSEGMETVTGKIKSTTTAEYYPKGKGIEVKLIFNAADKRIVGAQAIGGGGVAGKINLLTLAIAKNMTVDDLIRMEYCYTPPLAPSHNPIVLAAENAYRKMKRLAERDKRLGKA